MSIFRRFLVELKGGFVDLTFGIVGRSKDAAGAWHFHVRAKHAGQPFTAIVLGGDPTHLETEELEIKLFYEAGEADQYAEVFLNVGLEPGIVELREKYGAYRQALVRAIARVA